MPRTDSTTTRNAYEDALATKEWFSFRNGVLAHHGNACARCSEEEGLHVHHRFYVAGRRAWEYEERDLEVLCGRHHEEAHMQPIEVRSEGGRVIGRLGEKFLACERCEGEGFIERFEHYECGICFECHGKGLLSIP